MDFDITKELHWNIKSIIASFHNDDKFLTDDINYLNKYFHYDWVKSCQFSIKIYNWHL